MILREHLHYKRKLWHQICKDHLGSASTVVTFHAQEMDFTNLITNFICMHGELVPMDKEMVLEDTKSLSTKM